MFFNFQKILLSYLPPLWGQRFHKIQKWGFNTPKIVLKKCYLLIDLPNSFPLQTKFSIRSLTEIFNIPFSKKHLVASLPSNLSSFYLFVNNFPLFGGIRGKFSQYCLKNVKYVKSCIFMFCHPFRTWWGYQMNIEINFKSQFFQLVCQ